MLSRKVVFSCVGLALLAARVLAGEAVTDQQLGFRFAVPDGFVRAPERVQGKVLHAFQRPPDGDQEAGLFIVLSRLGGVIGREKIDLKAVTGKNPRVTIVAEKWKEFDLEVFRVPEEIDGLAFVTFNAQVPLKPEAVQVAIIGEGDREEELRTTLRAVLANLDGPSNWLGDKERHDQLVEGLSRLVITVGVLVFIGVVVWRAIRGWMTPPEPPRRSRRPRRDRDEDE